MVTGTRRRPDLLTARQWAGVDPERQRADRNWAQRRREWERAHWIKPYGETCEDEQDGE